MAVFPWNWTSAPFDTNLETDIRFDLRLGVCSTSDIDSLTLLPLTVVIQSTTPFPWILKVESLSAACPVKGELYGVYDEKEDRSTKQWSLAPESRMVLEWIYVTSSGRADIVVVSGKLTTPISNLPVPSPVLLVFLEELMKAAVLEIC